MSAAYQIHRPSRQQTPVVFASPHSGRAYPADFLAQSVLSAHQIRSSEDAFVDILFSDAPLFGAPLLAAEAPRAYIDLNRASDELDPAVIEGISHVAHNPRISSGLGVIPRVVSGGRQIYRGKLSFAQAQARINQIWHPYHDALRQLIETTYRDFGSAVLLDCHSMPHEAIDGHLRPGQPRPEVVLGDRFGASAGREVMDHVESAFANAGLRVARNTPFAGAYVTQSYGRPSVGRHVIQIEIDRSLYMDEARIIPLSSFDAFRARMNGVIAELTSIGRQSLPLAAE